MAVLSCLLCNSIWSHRDSTVKIEGTTITPEKDKLPGSTISTSEFIKTHKTFHTFCKYLDVIVPKKFGWNFLSEPLPFCTDCKDVVGCLTHLDEELEKIQDDIQSLVRTLKIKIEDVHKRKEPAADGRVEAVRDLILRVPIELSSPDPTTIEDLTCDSFNGDDMDHHYDDEEAEATSSSLNPSVSRIKSQNSQRVRQLHKLGNINQKNRASCIVQTSSVSDGHRKTFGGSLTEQDEVCFEDSDQVNTMEVELVEVVETSDVNTGEGKVQTKKPYKPRKSRSKKPDAPERVTKKRRVVTKLGDGKFIFEGVEFSKLEGGNYQCSVCPNILKTRDSALCHVKQRHLGEGLGKFLCHVCGKSFDRLVYLKSHEILHTNLRPHLCNTCGKAFAQRANLYNHLKIHQGVLKYQCDVCGKKFLGRGQLRLHMQMHLGIRPYQCSLCDKTFVRSYDLVLHMRSHNGERPYKCHLCHTSSFYTKYKLNRHLANVHKDGKRVTKIQGKEKESKEDEEVDVEEEPDLHPQTVQILQSEPITFYELL